MKAESDPFRSSDHDASATSSAVTSIDLGMKLCPHLWRHMTGGQDYGKWGPHFGEYKGYAEEICRSCGITRKCQSWQAWKYELDDAERRVNTLLDTEPARDGHEAKPAG